MSGLLVTEWIEPAGGAERVLDRLSGLFPGADMLALWNDAPGRYPDRRVRETWLARTPLRGRKALALPVMPLTWRVPRQKGHDWALVSAHAFAHHVRVDPGIPTCVYAHTPARYLWAPELDARGAGLAARIAGPPLRRIDRRAAGRVTALAANSRFVAERIARSWEREATVIHPPVDVVDIRSGAWRIQLTDADRRLLDSLPDDFILGVSRFIPYKRMDAVIAVGELLDRPVVIAGSGPLEGELRAAAAAASVPVRIEIAPSDALVRALMERAALFVFPPVEDFGIVAVEAMASGTPVMANRLGGAGESVVDGVGGALFDPRSAEETVAAAEACAAIPRREISEHALRFDAAAFDRALLTWFAQSVPEAPPPVSHERRDPRMGADEGPDA